MKTGVIVQARMSSQRLPGKVLHVVKEKPMLQYLVERLRRCDALEEIVIATSNDPSDDPVVDFCKGQELDYFRGSLHNVAARFKDAVATYRFDSFVRISGDSPLLDPLVIRRALDIYSAGEYDLVSNVVNPTYPKGQSVEVVRTTTYLKAYAFMSEPDELEHVTRYFYKHPNGYRIYDMSLEPAARDINLSVDSLQDMEKFSKIVAGMTRAQWEYTLEDILQMYRNMARTENLRE